MEWSRLETSEQPNGNLLKQKERKTEDFRIIRKLLFGPVQNVQGSWQVRVDFELNALIGNNLSLIHI